MVDTLAQSATTVSPAQRAGNSVVAAPLLSVENLVKTFPSGTQALKGVSFDVVPGEFLVVIGLSGSGKSTLLRCINRLVEPSSGRVMFEGRDVTAANGHDLRLIRRRIGMVFQQFNLVKRSSVLDNVLSGRLGFNGTLSTSLGLWSKSDRADALKALVRVGLDSKANARADALSGGQQQRVAIARALMQKPSLMMADEPVASLDPVLSHSILQHLEMLNKQDNVTVICSLHFLDLVHRYATRVIALKDGLKVFEGSPREIDRAKFKDIYGEDAQDVSATRV